MDFRSQQGVVELANHTVCLLLSFSICLEHLQLLHPIHWLPIIVKDQCHVQWLGEHLVTVITYPDDDGVRVEYDLDILRLFDAAVWPLDREGDEIISVVSVEPWRGCIGVGLVTPFVQGVPRCRSGIWRLVRVFSVLKDANERVLIWV